ncbi:hypothetical protein ABGN05_14695 [Aquibium sp. LZ166]|uniref:Uncharacterized protein n=1 Tax=Aquibium pacificus TaxID=3153579 RepID=A0ABV3SMW8_9HYPH
MATAKQVVEICERILMLPSGSVTANTDKLRAAGVLSANQAEPTQATPQEAALILLTAIVGTPMRHQPTIATAYADLEDGGVRLGDRLAAILAGTSDSFVVSLEVDLSAPAATLLVATGPYGLPEHYRTTDAWPRPAFERTATIRGELLRRIAHEIKTAPPVKKGRRKAQDRWKT